MDAIEILEQDHRNVERLFHRFEQETSGEARRAIVDEIVHDLSVHAAVEEEIFYPGIREALPQGDPLVERSLHEHHEVKTILADLDMMPPDDPEFEPKVRRLQQDVQHHVEEEETEIIPQLRQRIGPDLLGEMGREIEQAKTRAPTRPHPHAPDEPPGIKAAGPAAALLDRIRDAVQGRRAG